MTTMNTGAASTNFKEFRAALCRFNDANTPVSIADRVMILSNAIFLLDEYERVTAAPQADAAPSEEAYVAKRLSEALADVYMTIIGDDEPEADDGSNVIERVKKAAQVLRLEVDLYRSQADAAIAAGGAAQEVAGYQGTHDGKWVEFTREMFDLAGGDSNPFVRKVYAAPLPRVAATVWLPIETAPRGAKGYCWMNLAWGPEGDVSTGIGMRWGDRFFAAGSFYCLGQEKRYEFREIEVQPTHWMPLPAAPAASNGEQ